MENIYLQLIDDDGKSSFHNIPLKSTITIGKSEGCDIKIRGKEVAAIHAIIEAYDPTSIFIRSLNPNKQVLVNGKPVDKAKLGFSDIIKIGISEFQIKKVDVHETFPEIKTDKSLERKLATLTPTAETEKPKAKEIFKTPISSEEIERSIKIPEEPAEITEVVKEPKKEKIAEPLPPEIEKPLPPPLRTKVLPHIVGRESYSLRIKHYWWDVLISDNLYPLVGSITIGPLKRNTFVVPQDGLPKKFPIFIFEKLEPHLIFNKHLDGYIHTRSETLRLHKTKGKLNVSTYKETDSKLRLDFEDTGELSHRNNKFLFEFVPTPAPAARDKLFARLDKTYKRTLISCAIVLLLLFLSFLFIERPLVEAKKSAEVVAIAGVNLLPAVKPKPIQMKLGGSQGQEGEGKRAPGKEGDRGRTMQGSKGRIAEQKSQIDMIREQQRMLFGLDRPGSAFSQIAKGGGGDLSGAAGKLRPGLPGKTEIGHGSGLRGTGPGGGAPGTFVGVPGGIGTKGSGLGGQGTGKADWGSRGTARVTAGSIEEEGMIQGQMDPSIIERLIRNNLGYIKWCYEKELNRNPDLEGNIIVDFIIGVEGYVTSSRVKKTTMNNESVESCVASRIKHIKFPSPGVGIVQVYYPFIFRVAGGF